MRNSSGGGNKVLNIAEGAGLDEAVVSLQKSSKVSVSRIIPCGDVTYIFVSYMNVFGGDIS